MVKRISIAWLGLALALSAFARDEYSRSFDKKLSVGNGERVVLENKFGDVSIHAHAGQEVVIHADIRVSAGDMNRAKQYADRIEILVEPGSELAIRTRYPERSNSFFGWQNVSFSVHYDVEVPESTPLEVRNAFGRVSVVGVKASSEIVTSHGDLTFRDGRGNQRLENSFARVEVRNNTGDVMVDTSNGGVDASAITGGLTIRDRFANVTVARASNGVHIVNGNGTVQVTDSGGGGDIKNSFGDVTVRGFRGDLTIRSNNSKISGTGIGGSLVIANSFGGVEVSDVQRDVRIESGNGEVSVENIRGRADVKTSFAMVQAANIGGELTVHNANGGVKAFRTQGAQVITSFAAVILDEISGPIQVQNQNGAVEATSTLRGSCQPVAIRTSFSALRVRLEPDASYRVSAKTSFGKIHSDFPLTISGSMLADELHGVLGTGRCEMRLTNNNGGIEISKVGP